MGSGTKMDAEKVDIMRKFALFTERWRPKTVARLNGQEVKLVKVQGTFPWHTHEDIEEMFLVWRGRLRIEFRDRVVELEPGQFFVVPKGIEHRTAADTEAEVILFEPQDVRNTGDVVSDEFTAPNGVEI